RGDADERQPQGEGAASGGGQSHAESRVGARADVAGDEVDRPDGHSRVLEDRLDGRRDLAAVDHPFLKEPGPEDLLAVEKGDSPPLPGRLDPEDSHDSRSVPHDWRLSSRNLQIVNY